MNRRTTSLRVAAILILLTASIAAPAHADILPLDHKPVTHVVRFENLTAYPDFDFFLYPRDLPHRPGPCAVHVLENSDVDMGTFYKFAVAAEDGLWLFAVPQDLVRAAGGEPKLEWFNTGFPGVIRCENAVQPKYTRPSFDCVDRIESRFRVDLGDRLTVTDASQFREPPVDNVNVQEVADARAEPTQAPQSKAGFPPVLLAVAALAAIVNTFVLARRMRRT